MKRYFLENRQYFLLFIFAFLLFSSCSIEKQIAKSAKVDVLDIKALQTAHVGISIFDPTANKYLYNYQGDKYFVPASNIKIPTCYAAMKYLGDSLVGLRYEINDTTITIVPSGDPTFLHLEYPNQIAFQLLKKFKRLDFLTFWKEDALGSGWSWNDYNENYMTERSPFPIYGNLAKFSINNSEIISIPKVQIESEEVFESPIHFNKNSNEISSNSFVIQRRIGDNIFVLLDSKSKFSTSSIPFRTTPKILRDILIDTLKARSVNFFNIEKIDFKKYIALHSQPTDSLLKPMMHRSDNFFAEQSLLMVSNEKLGVMNDAKIIDTILKTDFKDLPQKPRWVDGSGLSRYNLFTPQDFVSILNKMKNEFGMERLKVILPTGGEGTISSYYKTESGFIFGKTGTLSGVVAFSGFLYTKKGKLLIFSTLVNNHQASATDVRKAVEKFLVGVRKRY